jgi:hypothetical protein
MSTTTNRRIDRRQRSDSRTTSKNGFPEITKFAHNK